MATAGALEYQKLMSEGKNLSLQRCTSLKDLPSRRKQRENNRENVAEKLQRRPPKFNQFSQNGVFGRNRMTLWKKWIGIWKDGICWLSRHQWMTKEIPLPCGCLEGLWTCLRCGKCERTLAVRSRECTTRHY